MEIKLNKNLRNELNLFLVNKNDKLQKLLEIVNLNAFSFSKEEINNMENFYVLNKNIREYIYIYI